MQSPLITVTSVSCATSVNNDCGILTLLQFLGNHGIIKTYDDIVSFFKKRMAKFGLSYDPQQEQMGKDLFEAALLKFMPEYQVELYKLIWRDQRRAVSLEIINAERGHKKSQYRLILISSWDHKNNTVGAGHFALLNTGLATTAKIIDTLTNVGYTEDEIQEEDKATLTDRCYWRGKQVPTAESSCQGSSRMYRAAGAPYQVGQAPARGSPPEAQAMRPWQNATACQGCVCL